jgi:hypothetical protein
VTVDLESDTRARRTPSGAANRHNVRGVIAVFPSLVAGTI